MGNCAVAFEQWKEMRAEKKRAKIDAVLGGMMESIAEQGNRFQAKEKEYEAKIRGLQVQIDRVKVIAKGKLTPETKALASKLLSRRKLYQKERDRYANAQLQNEAAQQRLESMRTNAGLIKQHDKLVGGMKKLSGLGLHVQGVETKLDSAEDVMENIEEFNHAFALKDTDLTLTQEDQEAVDAELEAEFASPETSTLRDVALSGPKFKARDLTEQEQATDEEQLAAMVMDQL